jgi:hypothetical protein
MWGKDSNGSTSETEAPVEKQDDFNISDATKDLINETFDDDTYREKLIKYISTQEKQDDVLEAIGRFENDWGDLDADEQDDKRNKIIENGDNLNEELYKSARRIIGAERKLALIKIWATDEGITWTEDNATTVAEMYGYTQSITALEDELVALDNLIPAIEELGKWKNKTTIKIPVSPSSVSGKITKRKGVINGYKKGGLQQLKLMLEGARSTL